jgi:hypothetical protein
MTDWNKFEELSESLNTSIKTNRVAVRPPPPRPRFLRHHQSTRTSAAENRRTPGRRKRGLSNPLE